MRAVALFLLFGLNLQAQYLVKNFPNLLPKKNTPFYCITQDKDGYLWMGSKEGLVKFDGKNSQIFTQKNGLPPNKITSVYCDSAANVWIGTDAGKVFVLHGNGSIDSLVFSTEAPENKITGFYRTGGRLFVSTYGNGLYVFDNGNQSQHLTSKNGMSDDVVYTMKFLSNQLWCGIDAGITRISSPASKPAFEVISTKLGLPDNIVRSVNQYAPGKLVIGMQDSGLCFFNTDKNIFEKIIFFSNWDKGAVINCQVNANGDLVFATEKKGLFLFKDGQLHSEEFTAGLKTSSFYNLLIDQFNSIWLASDLGVHQIIEKRFEILNSTKGIPDEKILSVICDHDQNIWAGTSHGMTRLIKNESNNYSFSEVPQFPKVTVSCSAIDENGTLYFGTYESGIVVIHEGKLVNFNSKNSSLSNDNVSNIFIDKGKVYVSTLGGGMLICKIENGKLSLIKHYTEQEGLKSEYIYGAITLGNDLYVMSDGGGLEKLYGDMFKSLNPELNLSSTTIYSLAKDEKGNLWGVTNSDGVIKYDGKTVEFFRTKTGLRDEQPAQIIVYEGVVYCLHSKGVDKIDIASGQVSYYDVMEGDLEPNLNSVFIKDGVLYSATNNGVLCYRIKQAAADKIKPVALISKLLINYKPSSLDSSHQLNYNQNNLSIEYNGIWTRNPEKLSFRYQLKGLESDWKYSNFAQVISYNNLDDGDYTFVVQSKNDEDIWSEPAEYHFSIAAPIWKSAWFWILTTLTVAASIYFLVRWRVKTLQKENLILEEKVAQRTAEIEKQTAIIAATNKELEQLSIVASRTDNVVLILSPTGDIEYVNESFTRLNNISLQQIQEQKLNIFTSSNNPNIKDYVADAVMNRRSVKYESFNEKNDNKVWEASTLTPIFDEQDNLKKLIIIDSDITESKRQQRIIEQKNKDITDSIEYARKIQTAILPGREKIHKSLPHSFVFYKTKDIVSGDFYWFTEKKDFCIIAAIDCTGHGVPGAFMSLIGYNILNKIVNENNITDPALILKNLNLGVIDALHSNQNSDSKDGMDAAICKIYFNENKIDYAGAMRPLWIVNEENITEIKADKIPIGTKQEAGKSEITYTTHTLSPGKNDVFYIFTDGYADQFGGDKGKKMGSSRFKELLIQIQKMDFDTQEKRLKEEHLSWKKDNEQVDDLCVIGFRK